MVLDPSKYKTGNPLESNQAKDLDDNARVLDVMVNDQSSERVLDRFGSERKTFQSAINELGVVFDDPIRDWSAGLLVEDLRAHRYPAGTGDIYIPKAPLPFTTGASFDPNDWILYSGLSEEQVNQLTAKSASLAFSSVANMKNGTLIGGGAITPGQIDLNDIIAKTEGYYGGWAVMIEPSGSANYTLTTLQRVRDSKGDPAWVPDGLGDHYLFGGAEYVASLDIDGEADPLQFGASGLGISDDYNFVQAALNNSEYVSFKRGTYLLSDRLSSTGKTFIDSDGKGLVKLLWDGVDKGISISAVNQSDEISVKNLIFSTTGSDGVALSISYDSASGVPTKRKQLVRVKDNEFRGETDMATGFRKGVLLNEAFGSIIEHNSFLGAYTDSGTAISYSSTNAIEFINPSVDTYSAIIFGNRITYHETAISVNEIENVDVAQNDIFGCFDGVLVTNTFRTLNQYRIHDNHISPIYRAVALDNVRHAIVTNNDLDIFSGFDSGFVNNYLIHASNSFVSNYSGNVYRGGVDTDWTDKGISVPYLFGVFIGGVSDSNIISEGSFLLCDGCVFTDSGVTRTYVSPSNIYSQTKDKELDVNSFWPDFVGNGSRAAMRLISGDLSTQVLSGDGYAVSLINRVQDGALQRFYNNYTQTGSVSVSGLTTSFNTSSDPRLKSEFTDLTQEQLESILESLDGCVGRFEWLDTGNEAYGFDAHKVLAIDGLGSEIGTEGDGPNDAKIGDVVGTQIIDGREVDLIASPASVDQSKVTPYLVSVCNMLVKRVRSLESKMASK